MLDFVEQLEKMVIAPESKIPNLISFEDLLKVWSCEDLKANKSALDMLDENLIHEKHIGKNFYKGKNQYRKEFLLLNEEFVEDLQNHIFKEFKITLPVVEYLIIYEDVKMIKINSYAQLQQVKNDIKKYNSKQKKRDEAITRNNQSLLIARAIVAGQCPEPIPSRMANNPNPLRKQPGNSIFLLAIDVESFERNHDVILEIGWVVFDLANTRFYNKHIIITEFQHVRNYKFVPDNKDKFEFGQSEYFSEKDAIKLLQAEFDYLGPNLALICHGLSSELNYFQKLGITLRHSYAFDTNELYQSSSGEHSRSISLGNLLNKYNIENKHLHNAGNDAHYTLLAFLAICRD